MKKKHLAAAAPLALLAIAILGLTQVAQAPVSSPTRPPIETSAPALPSTGGEGAYASTLQELEKVAVKGPAPMTGYERDLFGSGWVDVDHNGCDTRNDVLARDLVDETFKPGTNDCIVLSGTLHDPYTARTIQFTRGQESSMAVQIDHVVPLGFAWRFGAQGWTADDRTQFANDPQNLRAVDGSTNEAKRDSSPSAWLPPNTDYRCEYVAQFVHVVAKWHLALSEHDAVTASRILTACSPT